MRTLATIAFLSLAAGPAAAADGPSLGVYAGGNVTNETPSTSKKVDGSGLEAGGFVGVGALQVSVFGKSLSFTKKTTHDDASVTELHVADRIFGLGARFVGAGWSLKLGRAYHDVTSSEETDGTDTGNTALPSGRDAGLFYGAGLWLAIPGTELALFVDLARYQMSASSYHADEAMLGVAAELGGGGGGGKKSK